MRAYPTIRELRVRTVRVPMQEPHRTASGTVSESPLGLTDVITDEGLMGHSIVFTYTAAALQPTADLTPTAYSLEYADWWNIILSDPLRIESGTAIPQSAAGSGVEWNQGGIESCMS